MLNLRAYSVSAGVASKNVAASFLQTSHELIIFKVHRVQVEPLAPPDVAHAFSCSYKWDVTCSHIRNNYLMHASIAF